MSSEPFTKSNVARMAEAAAQEIESLRKEIDRLSPKAHAYDQLSIVLSLLPQKSQGYSVDMAWQLRQRAEELRATPTEEDGA